jgi:phosphoenolpyruvate carboxykinase (ATP)
MSVQIYQSHYGLENHGFTNLEREYWNLSTPALYEQIVRFREGIVAHMGPVVVHTGQHTGRSPRDKFIVRESTNQDNIWWGDVNRPIDQQHFDGLYRRLLAYFQNRAVFVQDCYAGADPAYRVPIRVITETAWHSLFARNMFIVPEPEDLVDHVPEYTVISAPSFHALPQLDKVNSSAFILVNFAEKQILIGGTSYAGEIKKSIFTILNYLLPLRNVFPMHCAANYGRDTDDVALFFGLSGTGKTSLSADSTRTLIGDDEHGWSDRGVFNFEGGCYAKVIRLDPQAEPEIYATTRRFGTILENVVIDGTSRRINLNDAMHTENTRASYPINFIPNASRSGLGGHPRNIFFLTADAFGVMPPISRLTHEQAMYHFLSGYTARVAGTEKGMSSEPSAVFSTCFGAPFMVHFPHRYAELLGVRLARHQPNVWFINTGWIGGPYGVGERIKIAYSRAMVRAALNGQLDDVPTHPALIFGRNVPEYVPDVPAEALNARALWADPDAYDAQATKVARLFHENFAKYANGASEAIKAAGPLVS